MILAAKLALFQKSEVQWFDFAVAIACTQLCLTELWAGLGSEPWSLCIPSCGALAALSWSGWFIYLVRLRGDRPLLLFSIAIGPIVAWTTLTGMLLCLRVIPFLKWRIVRQSTTTGSVHSKPVRCSLTRGTLLVMTIWTSVFLFLKGSYLWSVLNGYVVSELTETLVVGGGSAIVGVVLLPITMICVGLTLTRMADWTFYRRRCWH